LLGAPRRESGAGNRPRGDWLDNPRRVTYHSSERLTVFSGGFAEIGFLLFVAYLLFGPKKLPEIARTLGKGLGELRRASNELKNSLEEEIQNLDRPEYSSNTDREPSPSHVHDHSEPAEEEPVTRS
jgi:TatA/E family protein of Tat protein translocase